MQTYNVRARAGLEVPLDGKPRSMITADATVMVPDNAYYRRQIAAGDLIAVADDTTQTEGKTQGKTQGGRDGKS